MNTQKWFQALLVTALLFAAFAVPQNARAISGCSGAVVVAWGDTLSGIAAACGTSMDAILAANPGLGWWLYAGQTLNMPSGVSPAQPPAAGGNYVVQAGDTLKNIADRAGISLEALLTANPQITNINLIYVGQTLTLPGAASSPASPVPALTPTPRPPFNPDALAWGTLKVTYRHGMYIRNEPNGKIIFSAPYGETLYYRPGSDISDERGWIWVEVRIYPVTQGYSTGWMLVRDQYGSFFTRPHFRPAPKIN